MAGTKGTRNKKIEQTEAQAVLDSVKDISLNKVITEVTGLQVSVQNTLAGLSAALSAKIQQLDQMDTALALKATRLQELCGIENMAITLDEMKAQKEEEERQATAQRQERARGWVEEEAERHKMWKREQEDYEYDRALRRKKWDDDFEAEVLTSKRNESTRSEMLQKSWAERESALKAQEVEAADLRKQAGEFDARLKAEIAKAEAAVAGVLKREHAHAVELLKRDEESQGLLASQKVAAQEAAIQGLLAQIKDLQAQLASARSDAKDVATQALQSASGRQVAEALQRVVDAKDGTTAKAK